MGYPAHQPMRQPDEGWSFDPDRLYQRLTDAGDEWADKEAAASLLEENRKPVLAKLFQESDEKSAAAKEQAALATPDYQHHVLDMVEARRQANRARVSYNAVQVMIELLRSRESTNRAAMTLR